MTNNFGIFYNFGKTAKNARKFDFSGNISKIFGKSELFHGEKHIIFAGLRVGEIVHGARESYVVLV